MISRKERVLSRTFSHYKGAATSITTSKVLGTAAVFSDHFIIDTAFKIGWTEFLWLGKNKYTVAERKETLFEVILVRLE